LSGGVHTATLDVRETGPVNPPKARLLDRVPETIPTRHYSRRTEKTYIAWIRRYIYTHVLNRGPSGVQSPADRMFSP
jgi:hypothetical protein